MHIGETESDRENRSEYKNTIYERTKILILYLCRCGRCHAPHRAKWQMLCSYFLSFVHLPVRSRSENKWFFWFLCKLFKCRFAHSKGLMRDTRQLFIHLLLWLQFFVLKIKQWKLKVIDRLAARTITCEAICLFVYVKPAQHWLCCCRCCLTTESTLACSYRNQCNFSCLFRCLNLSCLSKSFAENDTENFSALTSSTCGKFIVLCLLNFNKKFRHWWTIHSFNKTPNFECFEGVLSRFRLIKK